MWARAEAQFTPAADLLAGVGLRCERVVMGILGVPPLAGEACWCCVYGPPVSPSFALVTLGCFHHVTFRGGFCERVEITSESGKDTKQQDGEKDQLLAISKHR